VTELKTEEEQIEAFKTWWKKNGTTLILAVVVGVGGYFGFQSWKQSEASHLADASVLFQSMSDAAADLSDPNKVKTVSFIADQLITEFDDTGYATFAHLYQAKVSVVAEDYDAALAALNAAKESTDDVSLKSIADLRITKILLTTGLFDDALTQVELVNLIEFDAQKYEMKGDILLAQDNKAGARTAYQAASDALVNSSIPTPLLDIKLQDLVEN